jgi:hypothetical protein
MLKRLFTDHPASANETYLEHTGVALSFSLYMALGAVVALIHAFLPFLFVKTGSNIILKLHDRMVLNRNRHLNKIVKPHAVPESARAA